MDHIRDYHELSMKDYNRKYGAVPVKDAAKNVIDCKICSTKVSRNGKIVKKHMAEHGLSVQDYHSR